MPRQPVDIIAKGEMALEEWFRERLNLPAHLQICVKKLMRETTPILKVEIHEIVDGVSTEIAYRHQPYDLENEMLLIGDVRLNDKSYRGLGTLLRYETENLFLEHYNIRQAQTSPLWEGRYKWVPYGDLPQYGSTHPSQKYATVQQFQTGMRNMFRQFKAHLAGLGGVLPEKYNAQILSIIEAMPNDRRAFRKLPDITASYDEIFPDVAPETKLAIRGKFSAATNVYEKLLEEEFLSPHDGLIHIGRAVIPPWDGLFDFTDAESMNLREVAGNQARARLDRTLEIKGFSPPPPTIK
ncbi:MAG: hypothetical protein GC136_00320 [Alphaproteobacteria bacterium]|nr:hypothetical protein [Alphaproteobacteria bacterium]